MALTFPNIDISGDPSEVLCTQEEAASWFSSLIGEYEKSISKLDRYSFNLSFLTKAEIQDINKRFAGKNKPTNVLSFPSNEGLTEERFLGDIAICSELIVEEAISQGKETQDHLTHIFVHGVLHLLGFDHEEQSSAEQMESLEIRILKKIGVADPY